MRGCYYNAYILEMTHNIQNKNKKFINYLKFMLNFIAFIHNYHGQKEYW